MSGGALLSQLAHAVIGAAVRAALSDESVRAAVLEERERLSVLGATKEQLRAVAEGLVAAGLLPYVMRENEGPLAGVVTAIAIATHDRKHLEPMLGNLKPWREPKPAATSLSEALEGALPQPPPGNAAGAAQREVAVKRTGPASPAEPPPSSSYLAGWLAALEECAQHVPSARWAARLRAIAPPEEAPE